MIRNLLKKFPGFEKITRKVYLYLKYFIYGSTKFRYDLYSQVDLTSYTENIELKDSDIQFFGYYDKTPWSKDGNRYLIQKVQSDEILSINYFDFRTNKCIQIGNTETWNYQQGAMLQWIPATAQNKLIYNASKKGILGSVVHNLQTDRNHFLNWPVQSVHPNGRLVVAVNYCRLLNVNSEYGYKGEFKNLSKDLAEDKDGIWRFSLNGNKSELLVSISELKNFEPRESMKCSDHCINHVMYSPNGDRMLFIHRWITDNYVRYSRLYVINNDGTELKLLLDDDLVSHYCWMGGENILTYSSTTDSGKGYYLINVSNGVIRKFGGDEMNKYGDGHPSLSPDKNWIITDTYPNNARKRMLLLWNIEKEKFFKIGEFYSPVSFEDEKRCDLHPRWHPSKPLISIDSAHEGIRKNYILNVESITGKFRDE